MFARVTSFKIDPARVAELRDKMREMQPRVQALPGLAHAYAAWRGDGHGIIVALYQDKAAAERAVARMQGLWGELAGLVAGVPRIDTYDNAEQLTL
jgi:quinol monooxygenase YgiN